MLLISRHWQLYTSIIPLSPWLLGSSRPDIGLNCCRVPQIGVLRILGFFLPFGPYLFVTVPVFLISSLVLLYCPDGTHIYINIYIYIFLWGAALGLHCCTGFSLVVANRGYSSLWCAAFSLQWLLLLQSMGSRHAGFSSCGTPALGRRLSSRDLVTPLHVGSSRTRDWTRVPCIGRRILNHCTTR